MRPDAFAALDDLAHRAIDEAHLPALAYGVIEAGRLVHIAGFGATRPGDRTTSAPDEHTRFRIASMTKSFTAAAVLLSRDAGLLALDDPVARHVPEVADLRGPTADSPAVTLRHLLTMSAGLATDDAWADRHLDIGRADFDALLRGGLHFAHVPGTAHCYSNVGYAILGRAVGNVHGSGPQQVISERLLAPLGLDDTGWHEEAPTGRISAAGQRWLDDAWAEEPALADGEIAPMGGLWSTVADLARWVGLFTDAFPSRDDPDGGPLSRASRREMQQAWRAVAPGDAAQTGYGMGLRVAADPRLGTVVNHSGGLPGFGSNMRWLPTRGLGVVALANLTYAPMRTFTQQALERLHELDALPAERTIDAPAVHAAAAALAALLASWDDARADALFADNVLPDSDAAHRRAAAASLATELGGLRLLGVEATSAATGVALVGGTGGTARVSFELSPQRPPRLQKYDVDRSG